MTNLTPQRILPLAVNVANQIAAGEVVERPASIVKELIENAYDANATSLVIDIGYGGLNQIKISDNGDGIVAEDLLLAVKAHATSKISQLIDLYHVKSLGFRGEALASIAAVTKLIISSKPVNQTYGMILNCHIIPCQPQVHARSQGTTVDVCDIFFNAPVRKKFLKTPRAEFKMIEEVVRRFAISVPKMAIHLLHNGKTCLQLAHADDEPARIKRMVKLMGQQFIDQSISVSSQRQRLGLQGMISGLNYQRSQCNRLWIYVNGRMVRDRLLNHAIRHAYDDLLHPGRHPVCVLYLTIDPEEVDVNVHPTKHEVRFHQPRLVHDFISTTIRNSIDNSLAETNASSIKKLKTPDYINKPSLAPAYYNDSKVNQTTTIQHRLVVINNRFSLVFLPTEPCLVDMRLLYRHWLVSQLKQAKKPLSARKLMVTLTFNDLPITDRLMANQLKVLTGLGIEAAFFQSVLTIKTLPLIVDNLEIKLFLQAFFAQNCIDIDNGIELIASHNTLIMQQLTPEKQDILLAYFVERVKLLGSEAFLYKPLSERGCEAYLRLSSADLATITDE